MHRQVVIAGFITVVLVAGVTVGCSSEGSAASAPPANAPDSTIGAAGSTFIAPLMTAWIKGYEQAHPKMKVNYRSIGSGGGIDEFKKGWLNFAASDAPLSDEQLKGMAPVVQVPATAGPVCMVYNLPGLDRPLRLSPKALAGIYLGTIISWQDDAIVKGNPGVKLPKTAVIVIHRSDGSGTTNLLTSYLSRVSQDWQRKAGSGLSVVWPTGLGGNGSDGVLNLVKQTAGTIGYMELNYAAGRHLPVAAIQNRAGVFVAPSPASAVAAIDAFKDEIAKDVRTPIVDPPASAKGAYPISGFSFLLITKDRPSANDQAAVRNFVAYAISTGQDASENLSYARLPSPVQQKADELLAELTANGQPLK